MGWEGNCAVATNIRNRMSRIFSLHCHGGFTCKPRWKEKEGTGLGFRFLLSKSSFQEPWDKSVHTHQQFVNLNSI